MNKALDLFARGKLLADLESLPESNQRVFKLMYGRDEGRRSVADTEALSMAAVVAEIHTDNLDWAMTQVANTIAKIGRQQETY